MLTGRPLTVILLYGVRTFLDGFTPTAIAQLALRRILYGTTCDNNVYHHVFSD